MRYQSIQDIGRMADRQLHEDEMRQERESVNLCECGEEIGEDTEEKRLGMCIKCCQSLDEIR